MAKRPTTPIRPLDAQVRIAILHGKEAFLRSEYTAQLRRALEEAHGGVDVVKFDGSEAQAAEVLDEARSFGLLAGHKLVVVDSAADLLNDDTRPMFERYAEAPAEGATLVLRSERWYPGKLDKKVAEVGVVMKCDHIADHQAVNWACKRASAKHGATLDRAAAQLLVDRIGPDLVRLDTELGKLAGSRGGGVIDEAAVRELVGQSREEEIWSIQGDLLSRDPTIALGRLREAIEVSRTPTVLISYAMVDLARKLSAMSRAIERGDKGDTAKALKLWSGSQGPIERAAAALGSRELGTLMLEAIEADAASKSGGDPERLLERLALRFANLGR